MASKIANEVRQFAKDNGFEVGTRGRLSAGLFGAFLSSQTPAKVREIAAEAGVEVPAKGRISEDTIEALSSTLR